MILPVLAIVILAAVLAIWVYRALLVYLPGSRGPILSADTIPDAPDTGLVSVIVPAKDEEANIRAALDTLRAQDYPNLEIIVVDDRSRDRTAEIVREVAAEDPRVRLVQVRELPAGWFGKPHAMHVGAGEARGRWLLFVDADCRQAPFSVRAGVSFLAANQGDMLSLWSVLEMHGFWENAVQPVAGSVLVAWFRPGWVNNPRRRTAFANGQYILIRRATYEAVGGYEPVRSQIVEDIAFARHVKGSGHRLLNATGEGLFTTRMYDSLPAMYRGWTRIYYGAFLSVAWLLAVMALTFAFTLLPFIVLAVTSVRMAAGDASLWTLLGFVLTGGAILALFVTMRRLFVLSGGCAWLLVFYPLAVVLVMVFQAGAIVRALGLR
ncbi:MAG: glycosyltransferase, partial [Planctomycetes bacterium]|nr:glycosyltransferase [Planctomycetota bacterium]